MACRQTALTHANKQTWLIAGRAPSISKLDLDNDEPRLLLICWGEKNRNLYFYNLIYYFNIISLLVSKFIRMSHSSCVSLHLLLISDKILNNEQILCFLKLTFTKLLLYFQFMLLCRTQRGHIVHCSYSTAHYFAVPTPHPHSCGRK